MHDEITDEQIVKQVISGDVDAYGVLINRFETKILRYIKRFVFDGGDAEDVLQHVFIKAYQNIKGFNFNYKFSPWIYRIAHNESVNYIRSIQKRPIFGIDWDILLPIDMEKQAMGCDIDKENLEKWLADNLNIIKDKYREVLVLYYFDQMTYKDISDILKIPIATVGVRIKRAKNIIKNNYIKKINHK